MAQGWLGLRNRSLAGWAWVLVAAMEGLELGHEVGRRNSQRRVPQASTSGFKTLRVGLEVGMKRKVDDRTINVDLEARM